MSVPRKEYRSKITVQPAGHFVVGWFLSKHSAKPKACVDTLLLKFVSWPSSRTGCDEVVQPVDLTSFDFTLPSIR